MDFFQSELAPRLVFILGIVNILSGTILFLSCRCVPGMKFAARWMKNARYLRFYKLHCYLWWIFWPGVIIHAVVAIIFFGMPF